jgi:hypothetical protein
MMNDYTPPQLVCPSCSGPSSTGSNCASCLAIPEPVIDTNTWIRDILAEDYPIYDIDNPPPEFVDDWSPDDNERVCPNCSGLSPTGGYCPSCLVTMVNEGADSPSEAVEFADSAQDDLFSDVITLGDVGEPLEGFYEKLKRESPDNELDDHHIYPEQFRERFEHKDVGIEIDDETATMYRFQHQILHTEGWNADWAMFWDSADLGGIQPTREDVVDYAKFLMEKYGFPEAALHPKADQRGDLGPYLL